MQQNTIRRRGDTIKRNVFNLRLKVMILSQLRMNDIEFQVYKIINRSSTLSLSRYVYVFVFLLYKHKTIRSARQWQG